MATPIPYSDWLETTPPQEPLEIIRIVEILRQSLLQHFEKTGQASRDVHAKSNGCAQGEFQIAAGLTPELAQGLFASPGTYQAAVRFSNSAPWFQPDIVPDGRGLAIQLADVPGEKLGLEIVKQDFVMVNHPCFIARDVHDFWQLEEARLRAGDHPVMLAAALALHAVNPANWDWREALAVAQVAAQLPAHPANYTYYSMTPIRYGEFVAKYRAKAARPVTPPLAELVTRLATERDAIRHLLEETLKNEELAFDFQVQLRTSAASMPIEDAAVTWPEEESPFQTVARLVLPRQDISSMATADDGERRAFSVWNALAAHRPLGGINRLRRAVYPVSAGFRTS
jgi:catalase